MITIEVSQINAQRLIDQIDIVEYIGQYVDLERDGREYWGLSAFREESNPSFSVDPDKQVFFDFSTHMGGNVITFVQRFHKLSYAAAVNHLIKYANITDMDEIIDTNLETLKAMKKYKPVAKKKKEIKYKVRTDKMMSRYELPGKFADVWRDEGISDETMDRFQVRYDPIGERIVFPIRKPTGEIINICGRTVISDWKEQGLKKYIYYYGLGVLDTFFGLYEHYDEILASKEIIVFEGAKSVMKAEEWGIYNTVAALTSAINEDQFKILLSLQCRVVFAFDEDVKLYNSGIINKLKRYLQVDVVTNKDNLLSAKESPVDKGFDTWKSLYERRVKTN